MSPSCLNQNIFLNHVNTYEDEIHHYDSLSEYIEYYNERRLHFSLDMHNYETPLKAFSARKATEAIRIKDPQWMEIDAND